ncbi:hypothetical protein KJZ67_04565 [Patescibacteria group bacterium]|nr:hypothetical protein [Patescibacteria group bacterium]
MKPTKEPKLTKWYFGLVALFLLIAAFLRIWHLDRIPTGIVMDEFDYVLNAKFVYHTGSNIFNNWSPWSLSTFPDEIPKGELTYLVSLPFVGPFGLSLFTARIGFALISIISVLIIYGIAATLFGPWIGLTAGFMASINPWSVYFGRTAYDVPISITFYLLAFLCLLKLRGSKILLTLIPLFLAFYDYIGTKLVFLPYVFITVTGVWLFIRKREDTKWFVLVLLGAILIFSQFVFRVQTTTASLRINQLFTPFDPTVAAEVDAQRRLTLDTPLTTIFANKPIVYLKTMVVKFFGAFSPGIIFTNGEGMASFALWEHGLFYPLDALFLLLGSALLLTGAPTLLVLFAAIILIAPIPAVFSTEGTTYVHRASLMYPFFTILIAYGIHGSLGWISRHARLMAIGSITLLYLGLTANFAYLYFFRFPYYNSESFGLSQRLYSQYTKLAAIHNYPVVIITDTPQLYFRNYMFYTNLPSPETIPIIRDRMKTENFIWDNTTFTETCPTKTDIDTGKTIYILSNASPCKELFINRPMTAISSLSDGGTLYMLFNDMLCSNYALLPYPAKFTMDDFAVENLSEAAFCEKYIVRYTDPLYRPQTSEGNWATQ